MADVMDEPLAPDAARQLMREILRAGRFIYSKHAKEELLADRLTTVDCENVIRGGVVSAAGGIREWQLEVPCRNGPDHNGGGLQVGTRAGRRDGVEDRALNARSELE